MMFVIRLVIALQMCQLALGQAKPNGRYCTDIPFGSLSLTFRGDVVDFEGSFLFSSGSAQGLPYELLEGGTVIKAPINDPRFRKAFEDLGAPVPISDLEFMDFVNDEITATVNSQSVTLTKGKC